LIGWHSDGGPESLPNGSTTASPTIRSEIRQGSTLIEAQKRNMLLKGTTDEDWFSYDGIHPVYAELVYF